MSWTNLHTIYQVCVAWIGSFVSLLTLVSFLAGSGAPASLLGTYCLMGISEAGLLLMGPDGMGGTGGGVEGMGPAEVEGGGGWGAAGVGAGASVGGAGASGVGADSVLAGLAAPVAVERSIVYITNSAWRNNVTEVSTARSEFEEILSSHHFLSIRNQKLLDDTSRGRHHLDSSLKCKRNAMNSPMDLL